MRRPLVKPSLGAELSELEKTDPEVGAAAKKLDDVSQEIVAKGKKAAAEKKVEEEIAAIPEPVYKSPNRPAESPLASWFMEVHDLQIVASDEMVTMYKDLVEGLIAFDKLGWQRDLLGKAEEYRYKAARLHMTARVERKRWELDNQETFAFLRNEAMKVLESEKAKGTRTKQITDADAQAKVSSMYPDEVRAQEVKRIRAQATEDTMLQLLESWSSRCRSLGALVAKGGQ